MLIDHTGLMILYNYPATTATLFSFGGVDYSWYQMCIRDRHKTVYMVSFPTFKQMDRKALIFCDLLHQFLQI